MKVSMRLLLTGTFLVGVVIVLAVVLVSTTRSVRHELTKNEAASEVLRAVTGIRHLTLEYLSRREERPRRQWQLGHASLSALLSAPGSQRNIDADILTALRKSHRTVSNLFSELLHRHGSAGAPSDVASDVDARLTAQIVVRLERMTADALTLFERSRAGVLRAQERASETVVVASGLIMLVVVAATYATLRSVSRPLARLREGAAIVGAGELGFRLEVTSGDEIGELARAFNDMTARLRERETERARAQQELEQVQADLARVTRVATLGEMTASIAHEINQPLGAIANNASAGLRWLAANELAEARRSAELVLADSHRASQIVGRIRAMAKKAPPRKEWIDLNAALEATIALTRAVAGKRVIELSTRLSQDVPPVLVDKVQVQQVVLNLVVNALEAIRESSGDVPESERSVLVRSELHGATTVRVEVRDSGLGLATEHADRIFDAFYTTKPDGLGMGLAVSRSIVEAHGGRLWATANEPRGATFQFTLPVGGREVS